MIFKESKLFSNDSTFINKDQPHLSSVEQSLLISPDRNKNSEHCIIDLNYKYLIN